ncbi:hypothetical protein FLP30_05675 [Acetobacter vaccinii]|uniref:Porin n=1 Tax=Acetobacter vaccinii TaxID=2592655 RepID=A0A5C1YN36_9PROT|nr:hypothetical protein FLP30_05675 [Acetobacter vaccinii]
MKIFFKNRPLYETVTKVVHTSLNTPALAKPESERMRPFGMSPCFLAPYLRKSLFAGTVLLSGSLAGWLDRPAHADDLDLLEQQVARIQAEQHELQKALVSVQKQIAAHRTGRGHGGMQARAATGGGSGVAVAQGHATGGLHGLTGLASTQSEEEEGPGLVEPTPVRATRHGRARMVAGADVQPSFSGATDTPEVDSVIGHRAEDVISRLADNNVGPHARETVGAQAAGALGDHGVFHMGPVTLILGGFLDAAAVEENRHTATGTFQYYQDIPFANQARYHTDNFEGSARYSRISLMARGNVDTHSTISGFFEMDFGAGAATTDAYESNSYAFRLRQAYMAYDNSDLNFHFLAGQAWSMLTPGRVGITPRQESLPETIESSMLAGQTWARQLQFRFVKDFFNHRLWTGLSIENSATLYDTTGMTTSSDGQIVMPNGQLATIGSPGTGLTNNALFSNEIAPDIIGKIAWDPHWGHYEVEGILHFPHDRVSTLGHGHNNTAIAGGGGGSMVLPVIPHTMEIRLAGLVGTGIGRYGSVLLPDATLNAQGAPAPLFSAQATAGIVGHPTPKIDVYGFFGMQQAGRSYFNASGSSYGYGNPAYDNTGCMVELSTACTGNTRRVIEATVGAWYRFFKGHYGTVEGGVQLAYTQRSAWVGQGAAPDTSLSALFMDFRYLPFQ